jgi:hypothetical protein
MPNTRAELIAKAERLADDSHSWNFADMDAAAECLRALARELAPAPQASAPPPAPTLTPIALHLDAGHTTNGNPRRCYLVIDPATLEHLAVIDEGFEGIAALRRHYPTARCAAEVPTTPAHYRSLMRQPHRPSWATGDATQADTAKDKEGNR